MQLTKMTDQLAGHACDKPSKSQWVKMQDMNMQDLENNRYVNRKRETCLLVLHLPGASSQRCRLIWCNMYWYFIRKGLMFFFCLRLPVPGYNEKA